MSQPLFTSRCIRSLLLASLAWAWIPALATDDIRIVTEELPPYNMTQGGRVTGMSTEVVQAVLKEIGLTGTIQAMPWARAYDTARNSENVLIYSIIRTPERDQQFKWIGVIAPTNWYLFSAPGRNIQIRQLDDARQLQIAAVKEDVGEQYLRSKGFVLGKNLQSSNRYEFSYEKLKLGRVDLWIADELSALHLVRQMGDDPRQALARTFSLPELNAGGGTQMAFGHKTPDSLVDRFRRGLEAVRRNGTYDLIARKWLY